jgi:hypothetical protein
LFIFLGHREILHEFSLYACVFSQIHVGLKKQNLSMRNIIIPTLLFSMIFFSGCCHHKKLSKQDSSNALTNNETKNYFLKFEARYFHTTESTYEDVKILNGKIYVTYYKDAKGNHSQWVDQKPVWNQNDLKTKDTTLTEQDIDSLSKKIDQYNFWGLDTLIGNPGKTDRYYPFELSFKTSAKNKKVIFKSVPGGVTMPAAFMKSRDELMRLARKKIKF